MIETKERNSYIHTHGTHTHMSESKEEIDIKQELHSSSSEGRSEKDPIPDHENQSDDKPQKNQSVDDRPPEASPLHETITRLFREHGPGPMIRELVNMFIA